MSHGSAMGPSVTSTNQQTSVRKRPAAKPSPVHELSKEERGLLSKQLKHEKQRVQNAKTRYGALKVESVSCACRADSYDEQRLFFREQSCKLEEEMKLVKCSIEKQKITSKDHEQVCLLLEQENVQLQRVVKKHETAMNEEIRKQQVIGNFVEPIITAIARAKMTFAEAKAESKTIGSDIERLRVAIAMETQRKQAIGTEIMALKRWGEEYSKWAHTENSAGEAMLGTIRDLELAQERKVAKLRLASEANVQICEEQFEPLREELHMKLMEASQLTPDLQKQLTIAREQLALLKQDAMAAAASSSGLEASNWSKKNVLTGGTFY